MNSAITENDNLYVKTPELNIVNPLSNTNIPWYKNFKKIIPIVIIVILLIIIFGYIFIYRQKDISAHCPMCPDCNNSCPKCPECKQHTCPKCPDINCPKCQDLTCPEIPSCPENVNNSSLKCESCGQNKNYIKPKISQSQINKVKKLLTEKDEVKFMHTAGQGNPLDTQTNIENKALKILNEDEETTITTQIPIIKTQNVRIKIGEKYLSGGLGDDGTNVGLQKENINALWTSQLINDEKNLYRFELVDACSIKSSEPDAKKICSQGNFLSGPSFGNKNQTIIMGNSNFVWRLDKPINNSIKTSISLNSCYKDKDEDEVMDKDICPVGRYLNSNISNNTIVLSDNKVEVEILLVSDTEKEIQTQITETTKQAQIREETNSTITTTMATKVETYNKAKCSKGYKQTIPDSKLNYWGCARPYVEKGIQSALYTGSACETPCKKV